MGVVRVLGLEGGFFFFDGLPGVRRGGGGREGLFRGSRCFGGRGGVVLVF